VQGVLTKLGKKREEEKSEQKGKFDYHSSRFFSLLFPGIYAFVLLIFCLVYAIIPGPEFLVLIFLIYAAYNQHTWRFLKDWLPFITVFLSYEAMYGVADVFAKSNLHSGPLNLEHFLFGNPIPTIVLQQSIRLPILDYMGAFFYSLHFFAPTIFAFILWRESPKDYWKYTIAFGILSYSALLTFLAFPVAPPWIAVAGVPRILTGSVDASLGLPVYKTIFDFLSPKPIRCLSQHAFRPALADFFVCH
jgi:hypothetical protein